MTDNAGQDIRVGALQWLTSIRIFCVCEQDAQARIQAPNQVSLHHVPINPYFAGLI